MVRCSTYSTSHRAFLLRPMNIEAKEPAFLRRLKNQHGGISGRIERPAPIPRKLKVNDDEDEPIYVDEESNEVISKEQYETLVRGTREEKGEQSQNKEAQLNVKPAGEGEGEGKAELPPSKQKNITDVGGGPKKRKQAKVVGEGDTALENASAPQPKKETKKTKKKIKLSFDEE